MECCICILKAIWCHQKNLFGSKKKILERNFLAFGGNADVFIEGSCNTTMQEGRVRKNIIVRWGVMKTSWCCYVDMPNWCIFCPTPFLLVDGLPNEQALTLNQSTSLIAFSPSQDLWLGHFSRVSDVHAPFLINLLP